MKLEPQDALFERAGFRLSPANRAGSGGITSEHLKWILRKLRLFCHMRYSPACFPEPKLLTSTVKS